MDSVPQIIITVAGASLATFLGSFAVESLKERATKKEKIAEFKTQLSVELDQLVRVIERLKLDYRSKAYFPIRSVDELATGQLQRVGNSLNKSYLLHDSDLQRKLFEVVTECQILLTDISSLERFPFQDGIPDAEQKKRLEDAREQRVEKTVELSDLIRRIEDITRSIRNQ